MSFSQKEGLRRFNFICFLVPTDLEKIMIPSTALVKFAGTIYPGTHCVLASWHWLSQTVSSWFQCKCCFVVSVKNIKFLHCWCLKWTEHQTEHFITCWIVVNSSEIWLFLTFNDFVGNSCWTVESNYYRFQRHFVLPRQGLGNLSLSCRSYSRRNFWEMWSEIKSSVL